MHDPFQHHCSLCKGSCKFAHDGFFPKVFVLQDGSSIKYWTKSKKDEPSVQLVEVTGQSKSKLSEGLDQTHCDCSGLLKIGNSKANGTKISNNEQIFSKTFMSGQSTLNLTNCNVYFSCYKDDEDDQNTQNVCMYKNCQQVENEEVTIKCVTCLSTYHTQCALYIKDLVVLSPKGYVDCCSQRNSIKTEQQVTPELKTSSDKCNVTCRSLIETVDEINSAIKVIKLFESRIMANTTQIKDVTDFPNESPRATSSTGYITSDLSSNKVESSALSPVILDDEEVEILHDHAIIVKKRERQSNTSKSCVEECPSDCCDMVNKKVDECLSNFCIVDTKTMNFGNAKSSKHVIPLHLQKNKDTISNGNGNTKRVSFEVLDEPTLILTNTNHHHGEKCPVHCCVSDNSVEEECLNDSCETDRTGKRHFANALSSRTLVSQQLKKEKDEEIPLTDKKTDESATQINNKYNGISQNKLTTGKVPLKKEELEVIEELSEENDRKISRTPRSISQVIEITINDKQKGTKTVEKSYEENVKDADDSTRLNNKMGTDSDVFNEEELELNNVVLENKTTLDHVPEEDPKDDFIKTNTVSNNNVDENPLNKENTFEDDDDNDERPFDEEKTEAKNKKICCKTPVDKRTKEMEEEADNKDNVEPKTISNKNPVNEENTMAVKEEYDENNHLNNELTDNEVSSIEEDELAKKEVIEDTDEEIYDHNGNPNEENNQKDKNNINNKGEDKNIEKRAALAENTTEEEEISKNEADEENLSETRQGIDSEAENTEVKEELYEDVGEDNTPLNKVETGSVVKKELSEDSGDETIPLQTEPCDERCHEGDDGEDCEECHNKCRIIKREVTEDTEDIDKDTSVLNKGGLDTIVEEDSVEDNTPSQVESDEGNDEENCEVSRMYKGGDTKDVKEEMCHEGDDCETCVKESDVCQDNGKIKKHCNCGKRKLKKENPDIPKPCCCKCGDDDAGETNGDNRQKRSCCFCKSKCELKDVCGIQ